MRSASFHEVFMRSASLHEVMICRGCESESYDLELGNLHKKVAVALSSLAQKGHCANRRHIVTTN